MYGRLGYKYVHITMSDGSVWSIAADQIAENRARAYATYYKKPLDWARKDTEELFEDNYEIVDWLRGNMNFEDVEDKMYRIKEPSPQELKELFTEASNEGEIEVYDKWPELKSEGSGD